MKDQELRDKFHAYRPQIDDNEAFMDKLMAQMDAVDEQQHARIIPFYRRILPLASAAAIALLLYIGVNPNDQQPDTPSLIVQTDTAQAVPQTKVETVDSVKVVKEILQTARPPKHYMAKQEKQTEKIVEQEAVDATYLAEQAIAEEEQRIAMQIMQQMSGCLQDDYQQMVREIRERGSRMTQQAETAINDDAY